MPFSLFVLGYLALLTVWAIIFCVANGYGKKHLTEDKADALLMIVASIGGASVFAFLSLQPGYPPSMPWLAAILGIVGVCILIDQFNRELVHGACTVVRMATRRRMK